MCQFEYNIYTFGGTCKFMFIGAYELRYKVKMWLLENLFNETPHGYNL